MSVTEPRPDHRLSRRILVCLLAAFVLTIAVVLWVILLSEKGQYGTQSLYEFNHTFGSSAYAVELRAEHDLSDLYVHLEFPEVALELRLTFLILFQTEIALFLWWRVKVRGPEEHLTAFAKRLFRYAGIAYLLCLVGPTIEDDHEPICGLGAVFHWLTTVFENFHPEWRGYLNVAQNVSFLWIFPAIVSPLFVIALRFLEFPFRGQPGWIVSAFLSVNALMLTVHTFIGTCMDVTYGIVLLGLANTCGAFAVFTKVIERKRFDAKWQAALEESPM
jgi:hypothetical protein